MLIPALLKHYRTLPKPELEQICQEADRIVRFHKNKAQAGFLSPQAYLAIPEVLSETSHHIVMKEHAERVLKEWRELEARGKLIALKYPYCQLGCEHSDITTCETPCRVEKEVA